MNPLFLCHPQSSGGASLQPTIPTLSTETLEDRTSEAVTLSLIFPLPPLTPCPPLTMLPQDSCAEKINTTTQSIIFDPIEQCQKTESIINPEEIMKILINIKTVSDLLKNEYLNSINYYIKNTYNINYKGTKNTTIFEEIIRMYIRGKNSEIELIEIKEMINSLCLSADLDMTINDLSDSMGLILCINELSPCAQKKLIQCNINAVNRVIKSEALKNMFFTECVDAMTDECLIYLTEMCNSISSNDASEILSIMYKKNNKKMIEFLINKFNCIDLANNEGYSLLCTACKKNDEEMVLYLISKKADTNSICGRVPIHIAAEQHNEKIMKLLVDFGADINKEYNSNKTIMHIAIEKKDVNMAKLILSNGFKTDYVDKSGNTILHIAAYNNSKEILDLLIQNGMNINSLNDAFLTPQQIMKISDLNNETQTEEFHEIFLKNLTKIDDVRCELLSICEDQFLDTCNAVESTTEYRELLEKTDKHSLMKILKENAEIGGYVNYLNMCDKSETLAKKMFAAHISNPEKNNDRVYPLNTNMHKTYVYSRSDAMDGSVLDYIVNKKIKNANKDKYAYVPIIKSFKNLNINEFMLLSEIKSQKKYIEIEEIEGSEHVLIMKINIEALKHDGIKFSKYWFMNTLRSTGYQASFWELCILSKDIMSELEKTKEDDFLLSENTTELMKFNNLISSGEFAALDFCKTKCTRNIASSLQKIFIVLSEKNIQINRKQFDRIKNSVNIAVFNYRDNYDKFAFYVYQVIHEVSIILYDGIQKKEPIVHFDDFFSEIKKNKLSHFGVNVNKDSEFCQYIAAPSTSGMGAYNTIYSLINKIFNDNKKPVFNIEYESTYFEINTYNEEIYRNRMVFNKYADVIFVNSGSIATQNGVINSSDINKLIRNNFDKSKHIIVVVDVTTAEYENLKLDSDLAEEVSFGNISVIAFESMTKLNILHSDHIQYGIVFGIISKKVFHHDIIECFLKNAEHDLLHHVEPQIGALISVSCFDDLAKIRSNHFSSMEKTKRVMLKTFKREFDAQIREGSRNDKKTMFALFPLSSVMYAASEALLPNRNSFGFSYSHTTFYSIPGIARRMSLAPSDSIDASLTACSLYFASIYDVYQLVYASKFIMKCIEESKNTNNEINEHVNSLIFVSILNSINTIYGNHKFITSSYENSENSCISINDAYLDFFSKKINSSKIVGRKMHQDIVEYYARKKTNETVVFDRLNNNSHLHVACSAGDIELVEKLLLHKVDVSKENQSKNTAIEIACCNNNSKIVGMLIDKVGDLNTIRHKNTVLEIACIFQSTDVINELLKHKNVDQSEIFHFLLMSKFQSTIIESILFIVNNENFDINIQDKDGYTALMWLCRYNMNYVHYSVDSVIKNKKTQLDVQAKDGRTALNIAIDSKNINLVKILVNAGANPNINNAFQKACYNGSIEIIKTILHGGKIDMTTQNEIILLMKTLLASHQTDAEKMQTEDVLRLLCEYSK